MTKHLKGNPINFVPPNKVKVLGLPKFPNKSFISTQMPAGRSVWWRICRQTHWKYRFGYWITPPEEPELIRMFCPKSELT